MRVIETDPSVLYKMGKNKKIKKQKIRNAKENDADDSSEDGNGCPHVSKAVDPTAMRKVVHKPTVTLGECTGCSKDAPKTTSRDLFGSVIEGPVAASAGDELDSVETTVCICLQCGHQGCDRNSANKHALKHYKTPHTGLHCIVVNLTTWSTWCYICDEEVPPGGGKIKTCIDFLQKQTGITKPDTAQASARPLESPVNETPFPSSNSIGMKNVAPVSCIKVKGLSNLGNTCFFNAVMQSMCQTRGLDAILSDRSKQGTVCSIPGLDFCPETDSSSSEDDQEEEAAGRKKPLPSIQTNLGDAGQVTLALLSFVQEMTGGTTRNGIVNPTPLFTQVCKKAPRFKGFQQQDSHELLRYLVDCIRTEEIKRGQASILKFFRLPETISPKRVDEETKMKVKEYGRQVKHTFLDSLFGGQLVSTVKCEECKTVSQIFEAFLDLSLPVMEEKPQRPNLVLIGKKKDQVTLVDGAEDAGGGATASGGADADAFPDRPSKYQERKNKRLAKKDTKRKAKLQKSKSFENKENGSNCSKEDRRVGPDSEGGSDESRTGNEKESGALESPSTGQTLTTGRPIRSVLTPHSSNTSVESGVDCHQDRGKRGSKTADQDETDDPSDADVEDNLESDLSRIGSTVTMCQTGASPLTNGDGMASPPEDTKDGTTTETSFIISLGNSEPHQSITQVSASNSGADQCSLSVSSTVCVSSEGLRLAEDVDDQRTDPCVQDRQEVTSEEVSLCEAVSGISLNENHMSGVDGAEIVYEVSVSNSTDHQQVVQLSNGVGRLTVHDSDITGEGDHVIQPCEKAEVSHKAPLVNGDHSHGGEDASSSTQGDNGQCQMSATFTVALPDSNNKHIGDDQMKEEPGNRGKDSGSSSKQQDKEEVELAGLHRETRSSLPGEDKQSQIPCQNVIKAKHEYLREARSFSMNTLAPRYHPSPKECSILSCLNQFTAAELLTGSNKFGCKECTRRRRQNSHAGKGDKKSKETVYSNASKQYLIFRPPAVLTLHLKRFEQTGLTSRKVNRHVDFPLLLDLAPYCSSLCLGVKEAQSKVLYSLYAVVEHSGRLSGGHYTAYIKVRPGLTSHTQFLHTRPPAPLDLLHVYLDRIVKSKELGSDVSGEAESQTKQETWSSPVDKDVEERAESLHPPGRWFHISDSRVNEVTEAVVLKAQAYLLFYERIF
ncbi:ubiquitinyl hydrolase 1 [Plakobranchus ocellatus]|uniref:ubiquitinyl hydrolase 1 n=1 Tax=Plakobranchus ocellatus TaxID=259542 RepID=A0AAV4DT67_9GAST|nr:ubiquitinyl hydrolase 1 [Plakobranchus ocellatus]